MVSKTTLLVCPFFRSKWPYRLLLVKLVMVDTGCHGRHSHCGGNDSAGAVIYWVVLRIDRSHFAQLRRASGKLSNFVLIRVARLTVETNSLTGTYFSWEHSTQTLYLTLVQQARLSPILGKLCVAHIMHHVTQTLTMC